MKRKLYFSAGVICLLLSLLLVLRSLPQRAPEKPALVRETTQTVATLAAQPAPEPSEPYVSPIDFKALAELNEDIYAWLYIPTTGINHPILQSVVGTDEFYLTHTVDKQQDENGCLFTEQLYNDRAFLDPVTVIYGHRRRSGDMFGQLQKLYEAEGSLEQYPDVIVYTPDKELHYQVFGETEFSDMHILNHYRRFLEPERLTLFLDELRSYHTMSRQFAEDVPITSEDRVLVLSTCLAHNDTQRFLVLAKLVAEIS